MDSQKEKAAAENKTPGKADKKNFISVTKDGETIDVCKEQVEQHQRLGWKLEE